MTPADIQAHLQFSEDEDTLGTCRRHALPAMALPARANRRAAGAWPKRCLRRRSVPDPQRQALTARRQALTAPRQALTARRQALTAPRQALAAQWQALPARRRVASSF